ncbi:hypothetical protein ATANTOWER_001778 [Ataeniobius toweri]|uniref:Uncharacterized protein n=1 Tax=Ataeniobius toweri TaxID=208326 RepID=A0ABU7BMY8_9TELE|nr:hypothetical protein [Ataeniobius toweri]
MLLSVESWHISCFFYYWFIIGSAVALSLSSVTPHVFLLSLPERPGTVSANENNLTPVLGQIFATPATLLQTLDEIVGKPDSVTGACFTANIFSPSCTFYSKDILLKKVERKKSCSS